MMAESTRFLSMSLEDGLHGSPAWLIVVCIHLSWATTSFKAGTCTGAGRGMSWKLPCKRPNNACKRMIFQRNLRKSTMIWRCRGVSDTGRLYAVGIYGKEEALPSQEASSSSES
jgi:hypothetical protein